MLGFLRFFFVLLYYLLDNLLCDLDYAGLVHKLRESLERIGLPFQNGFCMS